MNLSTQAIQEQNQVNQSGLIKSQVDNLHAPEPTTTLDSRVQQGDAQVINELPPILEDDQQAIPAITAQAPLRAQKITRKDFTQSLELGPYTAHIHPLHEENASAQALYTLEIPSLAEISQHLALLIHASDLQNRQQRPIYLAEQINAQGCFIKYLALLAAENQGQAIHLMNGFTEQSQHHIAAIKEISWENLAENFTDFEALFYSYTQKSALIWKSENYIPFIPAQLFQTQKFIQFEENPADFKTPLLLLKDRQKIRVIHGQKRLRLSRTELAYPYFLLERHHGVSWQLIQNIITQLRSPIDCYQLYEAIQKHISD